MAGSYSPQSGVGGVHIRQDLGNLSVGYSPDNMTLIADQVFKRFPVKHESDEYWQWDKGQVFNVLRTDGLGSLVADGGTAKELSFGATKKTYQTEKYGHTVRITDRERGNADVSLALEQSKTQDVRGIVKLDQEIRVSGQVMAYASYAAANKTTNAGATQWNDGSFVSQTSAGQSAIIAQFNAAKLAVLQSTGGLAANTAIIPYEVLMVMINDKGIFDSIKYTLNALASGNPIGARFLDLNVLVPTGMSQIVTEGEPTALASIWGKNVWVGYVNPNPGLKCLTIGLQFESRAWQVKQWREEASESSLYEANVIQDEVPIAYDCGYMIKDAIA